MHNPTDKQGGDLEKELKVLKEKKKGKKGGKDFCVCDERIGGTVGCVLKISHAQQPVPTLQREIMQPCRKMEKKSKKKKKAKKGKKKKRK